MKNKITIGLLITFISNCFLAITIFYFKSKDITSLITVSEIIILFLMSIGFYIACNLGPIIIRKINPKYSFRIMRLFFLLGSGIALIATIVNSFKDYNNVIGLILLVPVFITSIIWTFSEKKYIKIRDSDQCQ